GYRPLWEFSHPGLRARLRARLGAPRQSLLAGRHVERRADSSRRLRQVREHANSTGGKTRLGGITKRRNRYLRRLLMNGASANLLRSKATKADPWVIGLRRWRPPLVVAVALANKTARTAWAVMLREKEYQPRAMAA